MKCLHCGKKINSKSKRAKYCSDNCRVAFHRKGEPTNIPPMETKELEVPEEQIEQIIMDESHVMTIREYLKKGYFGGKAVISGGVVTGRKYFDFKTHRGYFIALLGKQFKLSEEKIKELILKVYPLEKKK